MHLRTEGRGCWLMVAVAVLALAGCASSGRKAPVEDRSKASKPPAAVAAVPAPAPAPAPLAEPAPKPLPGIENAGKPGYYTVKPGDTLVRVALDNGQNWRDVARWNNLDNPNLVEVGQVLRVVPPASDPTVATTRAVPSTGRVDTRALDSRSAPAADASAPGAAPPAGSPAPMVGSTAPMATTPAAALPAPPSAASAAPVPPAAADSPAGRDAVDDVPWVWPAAGPVVSGFDEGRNKGLTIAGKAGDPVLAAGDGRVVYAGSSLRGYGNLVIVKHNETYLTAYAHNQVLLVKDDQVVRRGQKIAEMGSSDAERVQLHFEIRRQGKPIDPARLLPAR
jgi:lipoprotein NlpD